MVMKRQFIIFFHFRSVYAFQYQPDELYCDGQNYQTFDLAQSTLTYEIPVVNQKFGDNLTNPTTYVELKVVNGW